MPRTVSDWQRQARASQVLAQQRRALARRALWQRRIFRTITLTVIIVAGLAIVKISHAHAKTGCRTHACKVRTCITHRCKDRVWNKHHPWHSSLASVYADDGNTASGWHAKYGVAHRTLPFGTRVRFLYGDRSITATVQDRGPFIGGREWDLDFSTMHALHFPYGVAAVNWRIQRRHY